MAPFWTAGPGPGPSGTSGWVSGASGWVSGASGWASDSSGWVPGRIRPGAAWARRGPAAWRGRRARSPEGARSSSPSPSPFQGSVYFPGRVALGQVLTLVVGPLAAGDAQFHLDVPVAEVQRERD